MNAEPSYNFRTTRSLRSESNDARQALLRAARRARYAAAAFRLREGPTDPVDFDALRLHGPWNELARTRPRVAAALELRYVQLFDERAIARALGRSLETIALDIRFGRVFLMRTLQAVVGGGEESSLMP